MSLCDKEHLNNIWGSIYEKVNPLSANPTKWSNTLKQFDELFECVWPFCVIGT